MNNNPAQNTSSAVPEFMQVHDAPPPPPPVSPPPAQPPAATPPQPPPPGPVPDKKENVVDGSAVTSVGGKKGGKTGLKIAGGVLGVLVLAASAFIGASVIKRNQQKPTKSFAAQTCGGSSETGGCGAINAGTGGNTCSTDGTCSAAEGNVLSVYECDTPVAGADYDVCYNLKETIPGPTTLNASQLSSSCKFIQLDVCSSSYPDCGNTGGDIAAVTWYPSPTCGQTQNQGGNCTDSTWCTQESNCLSLGGEPGPADGSMPSQGSGAKCSLDGDGNQQVICCLPESEQTSCPYQSTQARVQPNIDTPLTQSLSLTCGESFIIVSTHNSGSVVANDTSFTVTYPNGTSEAKNQNDVITTSDPGTYTVNVTTNGYSDAACQGTATVTCAAGGDVTAQCTEVKVYNAQGARITDLTTVRPGDTVTFAVSGTSTAGVIDKARFTVDGTTTEVPTANTNGEFVLEYTIPGSSTGFSVKGELHHDSLGWF